MYQHLASAMFPQLLLAMAEAKINLTDFLKKDVAIWADPETGEQYRACSTCGEQDDLVKHCPECQSINITEDDKTDTTTCRDCGLVLLGPPPLFVAYNRISYAWGGASLDRTTR